MRMGFLENIVAVLVRRLMSLLGTDDMWLMASIAAIVLVVLLLFVIILLISLVRTRRKLKRRAQQIDELESQVLGLQALTQLAGGTLSEDGDSVVYTAPEPGQQIHYDEFPQDGLFDEQLHAGVSDVREGSGQEATAASRDDGLALPSWLASAATRDDAELQEQHIASILGDDTAALELDEETREKLRAVLSPDGRSGGSALQPPSAEQIRHSHEGKDDADEGEASAVDELARERSAESVQDAAADETADFETSLDYEVDAILNSIKHRSEKNLKTRTS